MGKFFGLLALLTLTASCTEFLEENSRVLITGRFVDSSGQPVSGISAKVFRGEQSGFDFLNFSSRSIGEAVTGVDGRLKLTSFNTQGGDLSLYFVKEQDVYNSVLYNMSIGASSTNLKIELGDVAFVERAILLVNFVNSSGFNGNVPFEILYQDDSCRVFLDGANGAGSLQT
ncbi:MAG: hypothetical protein NWQ09_06785, partial [Nonlabens sp.]|nr:hypothetical protein [Nonlabens sp.]